MHGNVNTKLTKIIYNSNWLLINVYRREHTSQNKTTVRPFSMSDVMTKSNITSPE